MQTAQYQHQPTGREHHQHGLRSADDQLQPTPGGIAAGALEVIGQRRVLEACQALPAVGGADQLLRHVAGQAIPRLALQGG